MAKYTAHVERTQTAEIEIEADGYWSAIDSVEFMLDHVEELETVDGWRLADKPEVVYCEVKGGIIANESPAMRYGPGSDLLSEAEEDAFWAGYELALDELERTDRGRFSAGDEWEEVSTEQAEEQAETDAQEEESEQELVPVA
jgi:hypothetical protein